jgi:YVTN family beta-propeller protein
VARHGYSQSAQIYTNFKIYFDQEETMCRKTLLCLLTLLISMFQMVTTSHAAPFAYISNMVPNSVSVIDMASNTVTATMPVGDHPQGLAVNPAGTRVYVTNWYSNTVSVIDTGSNTVAATVTVGTSPMRVTVSPTGAKVYVSNAGSGTVSVIDAATNTVVETIATGGEARGIQVNPSGTKAYVANFGSSPNNVSVIDTTTNAVAKTIALTGNSPIDLAITPDGSKVYVVNYYSANVSVIDTASDTETTKITVGENPIGVWVNPAGNKVFVTNVTSGNIMVIDPSTNLVIATVTGFLYPVSIEGSPDGSLLYVVDQGNNRVSVLNAADYSVVTNVGVGTGPRSYNGNFIAAPPAVTDGLFSLWRGEGNSFDVVGNNHGALHGGTAFAAGKVGQAFSFDGTDDYVEIPNSASLNFAANQPMSLNLWVKRTSTSGSQIIFAKRPNCGAQVHYQLQWYEPYNWFTFCSTTGFENGVTTTVDKLPLNTWTYISITYDGAIATMYINGNLVASHTMSFDPVDVPLRLGGEPSCGGQLFGGLIDEVEFYNRALSAKEVLKMFDPNGPVSWWRGEDNAADSIGYNDGTWQGAPAYGPGMSGNAFVFNGVDNYVQITPQSGSLDISTGHSFNLWIKLDGYPTTAAYILNKWVSGVEDKLLVVLPDGSVGYYLNNAFGGSGVVSSTKLELGRWYHLGATYDGSNARLYINGSLDATKGAPGAVSNSNGTLYLGFNPGRNAVEPHDHLKGTVDEIKWYNRALSAMEIANSYGMVSWWKADNNALDSTGANNGVWNGTPTYSPGVTGEAFSLDGSGKSVTVPASSAWAFGTGDFAVSFWAYSATFSDHRPLINNRRTPDSDNMWAIEIYPVANRVEFHSGRTIFLTATNLLTNSSWNHIAVTRSGSTLSMYINGVQSGSAGISANFLEINDLQIGRDVMSNNDLGGKSFQGLIDEVKIFNRVLSAAEISQQAGTLPDSYGFTPVTGASRSTSIESNSITISGTSQPATISIAGGEYEINGSNTWLATSSMINPGASVKVRLTSSASFATTTTATLTIGGVSGTFSVTTLADTEKPVVKVFTLHTAVSSAMSVSVDTFTATDNDTVSGYLVTDTATPPAADDPGWNATAPATFTLSTAGDNTLRAWAKDPAGNVSVPLSATVQLKPVRREPENYYVSLQTAYGEAGSGETLRVLAVTLTENIDLNQLRDISISGGYEDGFSGQSGYSTISGSLTIGKGTLSVERVVIK